jgi:uncharacterized membrane protein
MAVLKLVGMINAAVWLGSAVFFAFVLGPAFFSPEMNELLKHAYFPGAAAQVVTARYSVLQYVCAGVAVLHLVGEWLYTGKRIQRFQAILLLSLGCLSLASGLWLQPQLKELHQIKYRVTSTPTQRLTAARSFKLWHGVSQGTNLFMITGVLVYFLGNASPDVLPRLLGVNRIRG